MGDITVMIIDPRWVCGQMLIMDRDTYTNIVSGLKASIDSCTNCISIDEMLNEEEVEG